MDSTLAANVLDVLWLPVVFLALGGGIGVLLVGRLRLPVYFCLPLALSSACLLSYGIFYVYFFSSTAGHQMATAAVILGALLLAWQCRRVEVRRQLADRDCWLPALLAVFVLWGYLCLLAWPGVVANVRFRTPLPPEDNIAPHYLADWMDYGFYRHKTPPAISDEGYRSSDRPPLQSGVELVLRPWQERSSKWTYQVVGTLCQLGWIPAFYALARTIGLDRRRLAMLLIACVFSGFFFMNSIYVWPKLLAASLFLNGVSLLLLLSSDRRVHVSGCVVVSGVLIALSLLAHGGPFFSLVPLPLLLISVGALRRMRVRAVCLAVALGAILLAPWMAYQRYYDPPGNRLMKIHLAGVIPIDSRGLWQTLADEYGKLTPLAYLDGRWANIKEQFLVFGKIPTNDPIYVVQWQQFFHHGPALGILLIGFVALLLPRYRLAMPARSESLLRALTAYTFVALVLWIIIIFSPGGAMLHHSSYATTALLFFCASVWLASLPRVLSVVLLSLHVAMFFVVWVALPAPKQLAEGHVETTYLILGVLAFLCFLASLRLLPPGVDSEALAVSVSSDGGV